MALKAKLTKDEHGKLDAALQALYTEKSGEFLLQVEGMVSQDDFDASEAKLAEFRDNNRKLFSDLKKFEGIDPDEFKTLKETAAKFTKQGVQKPDDIAALVADAVAKATEPLRTQFESEQKKRLEAEQRVQEKSLEDTLWKAGAAAGIAESAREDFVTRGKRLFVFDGDKIVARAGDTPVYSKRRNKTTEPLTPEEWATDAEWLAKDAPHLYKQSNGAGARTRPDQSESGGRFVANDPAALGMNLDALAKGEVQVLAGT